MTKSDFEVLLHRLTSSENKLPAAKEYEKAVAYSFYRHECKQLIKHIVKRLQSPPSKYKKIIKTMFLMLVVLEKGSRFSVSELQRNIILVESLTTFSYKKNNKDRGQKSILISKGRREGSREADQGGRHQHLQGFFDPASR